MVHSASQNSWSVQTVLVSGYWHLLKSRYGKTADSFDLTDVRSVFHSPKKVVCCKRCWMGSIIKRQFLYCSPFHHVEKQKKKKNKNKNAPIRFEVTPSWLVALCAANWAIQDKMVIQAVMCLPFTRECMGSRRQSVCRGQLDQVMVHNWL